MATHNVFTKLANRMVGAMMTHTQLAANTALLNELRSCPIPAQPVYGNQAIFTCPQNQNTCGCNGSF